MKKSTTNISAKSSSYDDARRSALKRAGAIASALALPASILSSPVMASSENADSDQTTPELEQYGIRGYRAPEIQLDYWIDANGNETEFSVKAQEGKWLFIKFWQAWCPGCHKLGFPTLKKFADEFKDHPEVVAVGVQTVFEGESFNTKDKVREMQLKYELPITMGHDIGTELTEHHPLSMINYRTGGTPWLILVAPDGTVVQNHFHIDAELLIEFVHQYVA